jgi:hypothetical protein
MENPMNKPKTIRIKPLKREHVISRDSVCILACTFKNLGKADAWIEFWNEPEADRVEEEYENPRIWVPAGATVRYENCLEPFEIGLCVSLSDNEYGGLAEHDMPIEAQFKIVELRSGSGAELIDNVRSA